MSLEELQNSLDKLSAVFDSPVVIFNYRGVKIHLRDLDAEEDSVANEVAYADVESAVRANQGTPDSQNFSRSMRATFKYRIAYTALAIRRIESAGETWDVDVRPHDLINVKGQRVEKFAYFYTLVGSWGSSLPNMLYDYLADVRAQREKEVTTSLGVEDQEEPPAMQVSGGGRFKRQERVEDMTPEEQEIERLKTLKGKRQ